MSTKTEKRAAGAVEVRAADAGAVPTITGYAAVFGADADIGGYFIERIAPGAFARAIARPDDVRALWNHNDRYVLGRVKSGTLRLEEDERGLRYEVTPPDTQWARDLTQSIQRGDVSQSSFCFRALREEWDDTGEVPVRTLLDVELLDVSPVTFPAYDDTEVGVRSLQDHRAAGSRPDAQTEARRRMKRSLLDRKISTSA